MNPAATFLELRKHPRAQLKLPARVRWRGPLGMRMESTHTLDVSRNGTGYQVSLQLELPSRVASRPNDRERRACSRISFALPIFVRALGFPWPEESMTQNISRAGARFESAHIYSAGDAVLAKIPWGDWARAGEIPARIVRVENCVKPSSSAPLANPLAGMSASLTSVAVRWRVWTKA